MKKVGEVALNKGNVGNFSLVTFDAVPECVEECPIKNICSYQKNNRKCKLRIVYIEKVVDTLAAILKSKGTELDWHKVSFFLVPLYSQLLAFKISVAARNNPLLLGEKGVKAHPSYKEIRETIKLINQLLNEFGITKNEKKGFIDGDSDYYESLLQNQEVPDE